MHDWKWSTNWSWKWSVKALSSALDNNLDFVSDLSSADGVESSAPASESPGNSHEHSWVDLGESSP